jgi:hypothetical protein
MHITDKKKSTIKEKNRIEQHRRWHLTATGKELDIYEQFSLL